MSPFPPALRLAAATTLCALTGCHAMVTQKNLTAGDFQTLTGSIVAESSSEASDRFEAVIRAPRRGQDSSVEVALIPMEVDVDLAAISSLPYAEALREALEGAGRIELLPRPATEELMELAEQAGTAAPLPVDLIVHAAAFTTDTYMVPGFDGHPLATPMLVLEARIESTYDRRRIVFEERGPLARNREVLARFTARVQQAIEQDLAPKLPLDTGLRDPEHRPIALPEEGFGNWRR